MIMILIMYFLPRYAQAQMSAAIEGARARTWQELTSVPEERKEVKELRASMIDSPPGRRSLGAVQWATHQHGGISLCIGIVYWD